MFNKPLKQVTYQDIEDLVFNKKTREDQQLDYKEMFYHQGQDFSRKKQEFLKDVTAFANANGGYFIYGVNDDLTQIKGISDSIKRNKIDDWISNILEKNIPESIKYDLHFIPFPNSENKELYIIIFYIYESDKKPIFLTVDNRNLCFLRKGSSIFTANKFDLQNMNDERKDILKKTKTEANNTIFNAFNSTNQTINATYIAGRDQTFNK